MSEQERRESEKERNREVWEEREWMKEKENKW